VVKFVGILAAVIAATLGISTTLPTDIPYDGSLELHWDASKPVHGRSRSDDRLLAIDPRYS
jgi:hypothetical protein